MTEPVAETTDREAGIAAANMRLAGNDERAFLGTLIDLAWGEALEDGSVPSSRTQTALIARARAAMEAAREQI